MENAIYLTLGAVAIISVGGFVWKKLIKPINFEQNNNFEKIGGIN